MTATDYLSRLALALPLVLALAVAAIFAIKRGWLRLPTRTADTGLLRTLATLTPTPGVRLVAVEFDGRRVLLAVSKNGVTPIEVAP
jgi:flagellar protein FliO/FliZ